MIILLVILSLMLAGCGNDDASPEIDLDPTPSIEEHNVASGEYLNHRFFRLDLPAGPHYPVSDIPGRDTAALRIDISSIQIFQLMEPGIMEVDDVRNVAAYVDTTGVFWTTEECPEQDFSHPFLYGERWKRVDFDLLLDVDGQVVAIDLGRQMASEDILAAAYDVVDQNGIFSFSVGDNPGYDDDNRINLPYEEDLYYRMKILKASENQMEPFSFFYVLRNIYSLQGMNIDVDYFDLKIEQNIDGLFQDVDENQIPYIQIFGLDQNDLEDSGTPDGFVDLNNVGVFDLQRGLLKFPLDFPTPFSAGQLAYTAYANDSNFEWEGTFLQTNQTPQLYDINYFSQEYPQYSAFRIVVQLGVLED